MTAVLMSVFLPGATWRSRHVVHRNMMWLRRTKWIVLSGVFEPLLYLLSIGVGVGALVGDLEVGGRTVEYAAFVAPGMLAASAMNGAVLDSTVNVYAKLHWDKTYDAMTATPLAPTDIALGELAFTQLRVAFYGAAFLATMAALGLVESWWAVLALPVVVLIGVAFGACGLASATFMRTWQDFELVALVQIPLFLFSATFYPLSVYPEPLRTLVQISPLYHGAALCRGLVLGTIGWSALAHVAVLVAVAIVGLRVAGTRFARILTV